MNTSFRRRSIRAMPMRGPYRVCPYCGANLDPGEKCDCSGKEKAAPGAGTSESGRYDADTQSHI